MSYQLINKENLPDLAVYIEIDNNTNNNLNFTIIIIKFDTVSPVKNVFKNLKIIKTSKK